MERVLEFPKPELWPLAGVMGGASAERLVQVAEEIEHSPLDRQSKSELIGMLLTLSGMTIPIKDLLQALRNNRMMEELIKESSFYDYVLEEGIEKGIEKGIEQGKLATYRQLALEQVERRFPEEGSALRLHVEAIEDLALLRRLVLDIDAIASVVDLHILLNFGTK